MAKIGKRKLSFFQSIGVRVAFLELQGTAQVIHLAGEHVCG
jgi:hypothetical protein